MPFLIPIIVAVFIALATTTVILNWDRIVIALKGKKLAVFGARGVGKTHLIKFLTTGSIPESYKQTIRPENAEGRRFQLQELDLKIKDTRDLPGGPDAYAEWEGLYNEADMVLYLLRIDKLMERNSETEERIQRDMKQIESWLKKEKEPRPRFFIIGTHCDLTNPDLTTLTEDKRGNYIDKVRALPVLQDSVQRGGGAHRAKVVLGSMKSYQETQALVYEIFHQVQS